LNLAAAAAAVVEHSTAGAVLVFVVGNTGVGRIGPRKAVEHSSVALDDTEMAFAGCMAATGMRRFGRCLYPAVSVDYTSAFLAS